MLCEIIRLKTFKSNEIYVIKILNLKLRFNFSKFSEKSLLHFSVSHVLVFFSLSLSIYLSLLILPAFPYLFGVMFSSRSSDNLDIALCVSILLILIQRLLLEKCYVKQLDSKYLKEMRFLLLKSKISEVFGKIPSTPHCFAWSCVLVSIFP